VALEGRWQWRGRGAGEFWTRGHGDVAQCFIARTGCWRGGSSMPGHGGGVHACTHNL
jgi:hypothetical protein